MFFDREKKQLRGLRICPHCGVATPTMHQHDNLFSQSLGSSGASRLWGAFICSTCHAVTLAVSAATSHSPSELSVSSTLPKNDRPNQDLPERAQEYLRQAIDTKFAPDGCVMLCGSAVDAMLKDKGLFEGTVFKRITQAEEEGLITKDMAKWAHEVRISSNEPRHADEDSPHASAEDAEASLAFVKALGEYLYVLPKRIKKYRKSAE